MHFLLKITNYTYKLDIISCHFSLKSCAGKKNIKLKVSFTEKYVKYLFHGIFKLKREENN